METAYLYAFGSVIVVSLVSLIGLFTISLNIYRLRKVIFILVALAIGALLGDAFIHLIPEAYEGLPGSPIVPLLVIAGIFSFFVLEKLLDWHHHNHGHDESEEHSIKPVGRMVLVSDGLHNLFDGVIIGASFLISREVGIASTIAILLHEIPQEIGDFGVLLHAGYTKTRALLVNFFSALLAVLGVIFVIIVGEIATSIVPYVLPYAAGVFIYIASSDLVPELHKRHGIKNALYEIVAVLIGVGAMFALLFLE
jgi:zinc and cadmium transporter